MPLTVQALAEVLRSWMVYQIWPAAPSLPWTDPPSAEAAQRPVAAGVSGPAPDGGMVVDAGSSGGAVPGGWDGLVAADWALQPVTAMAAAKTTVAMILAGRMATPPNKHDSM
jgi:hypothetical protein